MIETLTIDLSIQPRLENAEPTGEPCAICGEIPFLWPRRLVCRGWLGRPPGQPIGEVLNVYLCKDCADELGQRLPPAPA